MRRILTVILGVLVLASCKKSTSTTPANPYYPISTGNYWTYAKTDSTTSPITVTNYTITVLSADSIISGIHYKVLSDTAKQHVYLYRSNADSSYRRGIFANLKGIPDVEEKYFVKNIPVGGSWSDTNYTTSNGITVQIVFVHTIQSLDTSVVAAGKTYSNVAHIKLDMIAPILGGKVGGGDFYYAQGIGSIKYAFAVSAPIGGLNINQSEQLLDHHIN